MAEDAPRTARVEAWAEARRESEPSRKHGTYRLRGSGPLGHQVHPSAWRIPSHGGDHGLAQLIRAFVGAGQHADCRIVRAHAAGGLGTPQEAGDLEHRLGQPVSERGVPWRVARRGHQNQHGWPGAVDRQPFHRAAVEVAKVRGGAIGGAGGRAPHASRDCRMARPLQPWAPAHGAGLGLPLRVPCLNSGCPRLVSYVLNQHILLGHERFVG